MSEFKLTIANQSYLLLDLRTLAPHVRGLCLLTTLFSHRHHLALSLVPVHLSKIRTIKYILPSVCQISLSEAAKHAQAALH